MKQISLDDEDERIKQFIRDLPLESGGIELELEGQIVCKVSLPNQLTDEEKKSLVARGRELVQRSRERNKGVSQKVLQREIRQAVDEVRRRNGK